MDHEVIAEARREEVRYWQRFLNMTPRNDSRLTDMYARGEVYMSADEVARELVATDFIYRYTLYENQIEEFMRGVAVYLKDMYSLSWKATWKIVKFYGPIAMKIISLIQTDLRIPERMPDVED